MSTKVKGALLLSRRAFVEEEFGEAAWEKARLLLPEDDQKVLQGGILASSWYPFDLNERLDRAVAAAVGKGQRSVYEAIGAWSAKKNLTGPHKGFLSPGDPQRFLNLANQIYSFYYNVGRREYEATDDTSGVMTTYDAETFSETDCLTVVGWYKEALRMCGAEGVQMVETDCRACGGPHCRYEISWRKP